MDDCYQFTGQAHHGAVVDRNAVLLLDTNVLSTLYSVGRGGFDLGRAQDRRAAHLLRWLAARPDVAVSPLFGVLEGSGFHAGAIDPLDAIRRATAAIVFATWGREHAEEWIHSGKCAPADVPVPDTASHPEQAIELGELLLPLTVLPCYVAALATALVEQEGKQGLAAAEAVHRILASQLDFVPAFGWLVGSLVFIGTPKLRLELRRDLFKLGRGELRTACLSAGWDLGYLELMSVSRIPVMQPLLDGRTPLLVTEDQRLAPAAILLNCQGNSGAFELDGGLLDPTWQDGAIQLLEDLQAQRDLSIRGTSTPTWERCATVAERLEQELGIADAPPLSLRGEPQILDIPPNAVKQWLGAIAIAESGEALEALVKHSEAGTDLMTSGATVLAMLIRDNAHAHQRELKAGWETVLGSLPENSGDSASLALTATLALAIAEDDWSLSTAIFRKLVLDELDGISVMWLWYLARMVLDDTAVARQSSLHELLLRILVRMATPPPGSTDQTAAPPPDETTS
jgi:hypothetical protein